ncbi:MAG: hypothetical protein IPG45_18650 [Deltaproteobacteria bacterium]|nr:hypothetical protein [Deltaproteobacteria bacterium]
MGKAQDVWVAGPSGKLVGRVEPVSGLSASDRAAMWSLFQGYYAEVTPELFERDLGQKQLLIVLRDSGDQSLKGFSTIEIYRRHLEGRPFVALFSGDTIIDEAYWGQSALQRTFFRTLFLLKLERPWVPVYWFLISKGYKTYLLLARNFPVHYPRHDRPTPPRVQAILDFLAQDKFGSAYQVMQGILRFAEPHGRLKEGIAPLDADLMTLPDVRFFVQRNPGHARGEELVCLGEATFSLPFYFGGRLLLKAARHTVRRLWAFATASS